MKKKITTYVLLVAAIAVWGLIVYRIMQTVEGTDEEVIQDVFTNKKAENKIDLDTFSIALNYTDPFFNKVSASGSYYNYSSGTNSNSSQSNGAVQRSKPVTTVKPQPAAVAPVAIDWSFITFTGLIKNSQTNTMVALVNIQHKGHMMKAGDVYEGVTLLNAYRDSVVVKYMNEKKTIKKK